MAQPLKCASMLSLKEMVLRKLAAVLWNGSDILASTMKLEYLRRCVEWVTIMDRMKDKIMKLELPESLTKQMVDVAIHIGFRIQKWIDFHDLAFSFSCIEINEQDSVNICLTTEGTVDDRRMAEGIVRCNKIKVVKRYQMACTYWLEDCIPILWQELAEEDKEYFYEKNHPLEGLQFSWPHVKKDGQSSLDPYLRQLDGNLTSFNQWAFEHSAKEGYKATAEHFFPKLSDEEREASLMRRAHAAASTVHYDPSDVQERLRNVLHSLLSLMNPEQQTEIVKAHPFGVLSCFLDWPRRDLFLENAGLIWPFLPASRYQDLLMTLFKDDAGYYPEFFKQSPLDFKKYVARGDSGFSILFLGIFFHSDDSESMKVMFRCADSGSRVKLVFHRETMELFYDSMAMDKWRPVEVCLREATLSSEDRKKLKEAFLERLHKGLFWSDIFAPPCVQREVPQMNERDPKLKSFFDFLDGTDASAEEGKKGQKRKLENCSPE